MATMPCMASEKSTDGAGQPYDPDLMAAVTELGDALRELVGTSVVTTVPAAALTL